MSNHLRTKWLRVRVPLQSQNWNLLFDFWFFCETSYHNTWVPKINTLPVVLTWRYLTLSWRRSLSYRNQFHRFPLQINGLAYEKDLRLGRVKSSSKNTIVLEKNIHEPAIIHKLSVKTNLHVILMFLSHFYKIYHSNIFSYYLHIFHFTNLRV